MSDYLSDQCSCYKNNDKHFERHFDNCVWTKFLAEMNSGIFEACINVKVKELECTGANDLIT